MINSSLLLRTAREASFDPSCVRDRLGSGISRMYRDPPCMLAAFLTGGKQAICLRQPSRNSHGRGSRCSTARKSGGVLPIDDDGDPGVPLKIKAQPVWRPATMSALGHKRTFAVQNAMSALHSIADMCDATRYVCFVPIADIPKFISVTWTTMERTPDYMPADSLPISSGLDTNSGSIRQQDGQGRICQDVLGRSTEYPLSQSALRVGTLDEEVTAE